MNSIVVIVIAVLLIGLLATGLVLFARNAELQKRIARLERRTALKKEEKPSQQDVIRKTVAEMVEVSIKNEQEYEQGWYGAYPVANKLRSLLGSIVADTAKSTAAEVAKAEIESTIETEAFIDGVVDRIKRKQLRK